MEDFIGKKIERVINKDSNEKEEESQKRKKLVDDSNFLTTSIKIYKTIQQIKEEAIEEYNSLNETQKKDNSLLLKINEKFDILEDINYNILINDLNKISKNIKDNTQINDKNKVEEIKTINNNNNPNKILNNTFIEDYKKYRYTIQTNKRIELLNKYLEINKNLYNIIFENEKKEPKVILKEILLNLNELFLKSKNLKPLKFSNEYKIILEKYDYDLKEKFFSPSNFGNLNYKFSLLLSDFLKIFKNSLYNHEGEIDKDNSNIKRKFEKKMDVINLFFNTIKNNDNILNDDLYYRYLKIIYFILDIYSNKKKNNFIISIISEINNCMINLIRKDDLKKYIKKNPNVLYIKKNGIDNELNDNLIDNLLMNEILIYKDKDYNLKFDIKKYNVNILLDLKNNLINKNWINSNFEYIEEYNFIFYSDDLRREFNNYIKDMIKSPYIKNIYRKTETRFIIDNGYLFDKNKIIEEIFQFIHFFPFPFDDIFGYCDKASLDIYITMYDNSEDTFDLLGKLSANANDTCHEIFHISSVYNIMNSDNKNFTDFYSKVPSKKKKEYIDEQINFLKQTNSKELKIKKEDIDFGDAIEIECYGYCIREFTLFNVLNLFIKDIWYNEEKYKNFKENYIKWSVTSNDDDNKNNSDEVINIKSYIDSTEILKVFFGLFKIENNEIESKNVLLFKRKREFIGDDGTVLFKRELCLTPHTHPRKE